MGQDVSLASDSGKAPRVYPDLGVGVGLRPPHYPHILDERPEIAWFEAVSENYMGIESGSGGRPLRMLDEIRSHYPIVLHGVSLSIGSTDPLRMDYLARLKALIARVQPALVSDHLCWTGVGGENLHDLLPLPYTEEALEHVASRVIQVQEFLGRRILLENVSSYLTYSHSRMTEWEFLSEISRRADCGLLLDVNNVYVSSVNHGFDPMEFIRGVPRERVGQMHLAGYSEATSHDAPDARYLGTPKARYLIDTHDHPVSDPVWDLYRKTVQLIGPVSTLIEWDEHLPSFDTLMGEVRKAEAIHGHA